MVSFFLASGQVHRLGTDHGDNNNKKKSLQLLTDKIWRHNGRKE